MLRALAVLSLVSLLPPATRAEEAPNLIYINIDDLGYADIGPFGSTLNRTPNLDRMAAEGMKLTCYYAAPTCTPSRASLMTGCYPKRVGLPVVIFPESRIGLAAEEPTLPRRLKELGYATGCIGKWHLGDQPEFLPTRRGFDYYLGIPYSNDMGPAEDGSKSSLGEATPEPRLANLQGDDELGKRGRSQPPLPLLENEKVVARVRQEEQQGIVRRYTDAAVKFIRDHRDRRFFLYLPHTAVHFPIWPGKDFQHRSKNGIYGDWVEEVDWSVGRVLDAVRELGLERRTLVIFSSDNGGTPRAVNRPLRGFKGSTWEGGVREPTLAWWPGKVPANSSSDAIVSTMDVMPTFLKLAGAEMPGHPKTDGVDVWPVLRGDRDAKPRDTFYYFSGHRLEGVRRGPWKLHFPPPRTGRTGQGQETRGAAPKAALYHLESDLGEEKDVGGQHPEIVAELQRLADAIDADLGRNAAGPGCRSPGRVANSAPLIGHDGRIRDGFTP